MNKNNALVSGLMGEQLTMEMMVPKRANEATKTSEELPVSLPVSIQGKKEDMKDISSRKSRVKLKNAVIHQCQIPGQH